MGVVEREGMGTGVIEREGEAVRSLFSNENTVRVGRSGGYVMKYTHSLMHRVSRTCWPIMKSPGQGGQPSSSRERVSGSRAVGRISTDSTDYRIKSIAQPTGKYGTPDLAERRFIPLPYTFGTSFVIVRAHSPRYGGPPCSGLDWASTAVGVSLTHPVPPLPNKQYISSTNCNPSSM